MNRVYGFGLAAWVLVVLLRPATAQDASPPVMRAFPANLRHARISSPLSTTLGVPRSTISRPCQDPSRAPLEVKPSTQAAKPPGMGLPTPTNPVTDLFNKLVPNPRQQRELRIILGQTPLGPPISSLEHGAENVKEEVQKTNAKIEARRTEEEKRKEQLDKAIAEFTKNFPIKIVTPTPAPRAPINIDPSPRTPRSPNTPRNMTSSPIKIGPSVSPRTPDPNSQTFGIDQQRKEQREASRPAGRGSRARSGNTRL